MPSIDLAIIGSCGSAYESAAGQVDKEQQWLPQLAPHLPLAILFPLQREHRRGYPWNWSIYRWLEGENVLASPILVSGSTVSAVCRCPAPYRCYGGHSPDSITFFRGVPLAMRASATREAIASLHDLIDTDAATAIWKTALQAPVWERSPSGYTETFKQGTCYR